MPPCTASVAPSIAVVIAAWTNAEPSPRLPAIKLVIASRPNALAAISEIAEVIPTLLARVCAYSSAASSVIPCFKASAFASSYVPAASPP